MVLLRHPLVFSRKGKEEAAIQSGPTLIEIKHGGAKKIEYTYTSKEGTEKKCAVYKDFKHKIPNDMRSFIDKNSEVLEVIRVEDVYCKSKFASASNIPEMREISKPMAVYTKSTASRLTQQPNREAPQSQRFLEIPNSSIVNGVVRPRIINQNNSVSNGNSPIRNNSSFENDSPMSNPGNVIEPQRLSESSEEEKAGEPNSPEIRNESFCSDEDSSEEGEREWNLSSFISNDRASISAP
eukprot:CAMPEP_0205810220 /NCGR_PEP_ID=MMETSP0205-20121125/14397_1 /ASSEMBLY_ACC=CAM_ASM_000278 /TAXON_ID=36767 /ORGANISM="Euplotes focardii, Strain TN1" /LENGTH=238 /DNA_ID=CAMNT_0053088127 /DNA_START=133 /DNA_END=845 /DNA_ORIENTATION=+